MDRDAFVQKILDVYNSHRVEAFDELLTEDCVLVRNGVEARGRDEVERVVGRLYRAIPDVRYDADDAILAGDKVALRWHGRGTQQGTYLGVAAPGGEVSYDGITIYELRDGRIARIWVSANVLGLRQPAAPEPEARV